MISQANTFSLIERKATFSIAGIFAVRLLGLFMVVPMFSLYASTLKNSTPLLMGIALGCYGLTQALLQIPFGLCSDRYGRKHIIALGLIIFTLGSFGAALSHTIWGMIISRSLQGAGAIGGATNALLADLTSAQNRLKAMAIVGVTIGIAFAAAMVLGPLLASWVNVPGIFWVSSLLGLLGLLILYHWTPTEPRLHHIPQHNLSLFTLFFNPLLLPLNFGVLILHALLTATFVVLPTALQNIAGLPEKQQWHVYLPVLLLAFLAMIPFIIAANKKKWSRFIFLCAIALLACAELLLWLLTHSVIGIAIGLWLFFTAFTLLEALLPSLVSKVAPSERKGTALGIYSCCQFIGIFIGGSIGGWLYGHFPVNGVFVANMMLAGIWLLYSLRTVNH